MRYTEIDRRIEALAGKQHGAFTRQQAFDLGASERFIGRRLAARDWRRPLPGVYVLAGSPGTWRRQCKVAELSVPGAAIAGRAAAALHELTGFRPGPIEIVASPGSFSRHPLALVHRYVGAKLTVVHGITTTTIPQTLFDVAVDVDPWRLERATDDALMAKRITVAELDERLTFYAGSRRPGLARIRPLVVERLSEGWTPAESELEAMLLGVLDQLPSRPRIDRQAAMPWRCASGRRVDVLLPDHALIIEADGRRWHTRVADFDRDRWRDNEAVANGYRVMRFTWVHLHDLVDDVLDLLNRTIGSPATAA